MGDPKTIHKDAGQNLVIGFLLRGAVTAFDQTPAAIQDGPLLFQPTVGGVVRGYQTSPAAGRAAPQENIPYVQLQYKGEEGLLRQRGKSLFQRNHQ